MAAFGFITVAPVQDGSMTEDIAKAVQAIEDSGIWYEVTPMGTLLEAESASEIFRVAERAHEAVDSNRVLTSLKIDEKHGVDQRAWDKVDDLKPYLER